MLQYGSPFYILSLMLLLGSTATIWQILRRKNLRIQKAVILGLMLLNLFQHLFKASIYPMYFGRGFTAISTAYNMCALLIIFLPLAFLLKSRFLKNFFYFVGTVAGISAIAVPVWYIGKDVSDLGWDYFRFYLCHALLFISSLLPLLLHIHTPSYKEFWQVGLAFLLALCVIVLNDFIFMAMGLYPEGNIETFYQSLQSINPVGLMGPPKGLPWIEKIIRIFSPSIFMGNNPNGIYVPILWYAIPLYIGISFLSFLIFILMDKDNFIRKLRTS